MMLLSKACGKTHSELLLEKIQIDEETISKLLRICLGELES
jgi:hypothetical protein